MSSLIHTAGNFQYSVNIAYDLNNSEKLKGFIPTKSSLDLLEDIILSTQESSTKRARILIGAYGKGKSHIVLSILSILKHHEPKSDFIHLNKKLEKNPRLNQLVENYYENGKKLLPVLIGGNGGSLTQSFLVSLKNTLSENNLSDFMPETNYKAAIKTIQGWEKNYPETLRLFEEKADCPSSIIISRLKDFNLETYIQFEKIYPSVTSGSHFNPFLGFDVVEIYESVAKELRRRKLYDGLYVVYDEFSKYLESNIETASISDTKMLQDFAEKSCRSGDNQLHLLLISHKEIANYIDKLPKQKTDGWRGISERFEHILLNNNFSQVYEIISSVIQKDEKKWEIFSKEHDEDFNLLVSNYSQHELFKEFSEKDEIEKLVKQTFPLHPVSTFILPRLSERIAQNERTLFTFLSSDSSSTLPSFLKTFNDSDFALVTPDLIFDYFEPLLKKEIYNGEIFETYHLTSIILEKLNDAKNEETELEQKIIKTISLIYILAHFEKLKPVAEEIIRIYSCSYSKEEIENALKNLIEKELVVYLRQSNSYLTLKKTSGVDIAKNIHDEIERQKRDFVLSDVLNQNNDERYFYPYRYNDEKEMTRFFEFDFVELEDAKTGEMSQKSSSDGKIIAVLCKNSEESEEAKKVCQEISRNSKFVTVVLKKYSDIKKAAAELSAINELCKKALSDEILLAEYNVVLDDLREVGSDYIKKYIHPEFNCCHYFHEGKEVIIKRRSGLTELLSDICFKIYSKTPVINNEAINKNDITQMAYNSRRKILAALLRNPLEKNLGLTGNGQDVAIMRSTLLHVGLLVQDEKEEIATLNFDFKSDKYLLKPMLEAITDFTEEASSGKTSFSNLYEKLTSSDYGLALRKGIIPIYLAAVFGRIKNQLVLYHEDRQIPLNADSLAFLNEKPHEFSLLRYSLDENKRAYLSELKSAFHANGENAEEISFAVQNWYLSLSRYCRESKTKYSPLIKALKDGSGAQELIFSKLPASVGKKDCDQATALEIKKAKSFYDSLPGDLKSDLENELNIIFGQKDFSAWLRNLKAEALNHLFSDGAERLIKVLQKTDLNQENLISELAVTATGLRLEDWSDSTKDKFLAQIKEWKQSAENFSGSGISAEQNQVEEKTDSQNSYSVTFPSSGGKFITKRFDKVEPSPRARLLHNKLTDALETMGKSMNDSEKRQVLMDVLQKLCGGES